MLFAAAKKDRPRAVEIAREGMMNSKAISCVQAIATAGILMLSTTAFGEDASGVPDSALKGKKVAYVACSDLNDGAGNSDIRSFRRSRPKASS
jgi:hypothetical protein